MGGGEILGSVQRVPRSVAIITWYAECAANVWCEHRVMNKTAVCFGKESKNRAGRWGHSTPLSRGVIGRVSQAEWCSA